MTTTTTTSTMGPIPAPWLAAMHRATREHMRTFRLADGSFAAPSRSQPSLHYHVTVEGGKITGCSCPATVICKHQGAVAKRLLIERFGDRAVRRALNPTQPVAQEVDTAA